MNMSGKTFFAVVACISTLAICIVLAVGFATSPSNGSNRASNSRASTGKATTEHDNAGGTFTIQLSEGVSNQIITSVTVVVAIIVVGLIISYHVRKERESKVKHTPTSTTT